MIEKDADEFIEEFESETAQGFTSEAQRVQTLQDIAEQDEQIKKAISPNRTEEENDALRRKQEQVAKLREKANKPRSLIDESELSRQQRKILRLVMNIVHKICGAELAKQVAEGISAKLREKARKDGKEAQQKRRDDNVQEARTG